MLPVIANSPCCVGMPAPIITGSTNACINGSYTYSVPLVAGATYQWTVQGGTIVAGQGTNAVQIMWNAGVVGTLNVEQTNQQ